MKPPISFKHKRKLVLIISPLIIYGLISLIFFHPPHWSDLTTKLFTSSPDTKTDIWFLNWWPFALAHHLNPFISKYIWHPAEANLAWSTSIPALAFLAIPITLLGSAGVSFNILTLLAPVLSAGACFYLVYYLTKKFTPSLIAGYLFGFSSYEMGQMQGHINLYMTFALPLALLLFMARLDKRISKPVYIILLALVMAFLFGTSIELFTLFGFFAVLALIVFYIAADDKLRKKLIAMLYESFWALVVALITLSPYLYYLLRDYGAQPGIINSPITYSADLVNYIIPTPLTYLGANQFTSITSRFTGNFSETGAYLGIPLVFVITSYAVTAWRSRFTKALVAILVILVVCSLGPRLHIAGIATTLRLPWTIAMHLPILRLALPTRFTLYVSLVAAIIMGLWLARSSSRNMTIFKYVVAALVVVSLMPNVQRYRWDSAEVPPIFAQATVSNYLKRNENIIILPYWNLGQGTYYQYTSGMYFTQTGGYIGITAAPFTWEFVTPSAYPTFTKDLAAFCESSQIDAIVYTDDTAPELVRALRATGWPIKHEGGANLVTPPSS